MPLFFAYDSYLDADLLKKYCRNARPVTRARVLDHSLHFVRLQASQKGQLAGYIDMVDKPGDDVWGVLYRLEQDDLRFLDRYEQVPEKSRRDIIDIVTDNGSNISAYTLLVNRDSPLGRPREQFELAIQGAKNHGLPNDYVTKLEQMLSVFSRGK